VETGPCALFPIGKHRYHVQNEQRDQNERIDARVRDWKDGGVIK